VDTAVRRVALRIGINGATTARAFFGPFLDGECVESLSLYLDATASVIGDVVLVEVAAFGNSPTDSAAAFASDGRPLFPVAVALPALSKEWDLPLGFFACPAERFIMIQVTGLAGHVFDGSVWLKMRLFPPSNAHTNMVPVPDNQE
jgi:hypothetical protein